MATTQTITTRRPPKAATRCTTTTTRLHVCFSFAAYAKTIIDHLNSLNIPILPGLTDHEFAAIEAAFHLSFPPDLRSILQEGLPVGPLFPNWRSSSPQQLQILLSLPSLNLSKNISQNSFWVDSWGDKPSDGNKAARAAKVLLEKAPVLVPIYRNLYIPSTPNAAGNPVFYVDDVGVRVQSFDITRFFQEFEFLQIGVARPGKIPTNVPAWAPTTARKICFWTEVAERGRRMMVREATGGWWSNGEICRGRNELGQCLEEVFWRLRDGGWGEEDVKEMMMINGCDPHDRLGAHLDKQKVLQHLTELSRVLLSAGWSNEDVMHSLHLHDHPIEDHSKINEANFDGRLFLDFQPRNCCSSKTDYHHHKMNLKHLKI